MRQESAASSDAGGVSAAPGPGRAARRAGRRAARAWHRPQAARCGPARRAPFPRGAVWTAPQPAGVRQPRASKRRRLASVATRPRHARPRESPRRAAARVALGRRRGAPRAPCRRAPRRAPPGGSTRRRNGRPDGSTYAAARALGSGRPRRRAAGRGPCGPRRRRRQPPPRHVEQRARRARPGPRLGVGKRVAAAARVRDLDAERWTVVRRDVGVDGSGFAGQAAGQAGPRETGPRRRGKTRLHRWAGCRGQIEPSVHTIQCAPKRGRVHSASVSRGVKNTHRISGPAVERPAQGVEDDVPHAGGQRRAGGGGRLGQGATHEGAGRPPRHAGYGRGGCGPQVNAPLAWRPPVLVV